MGRPVCDYQVFDPVTLCFEFLRRAEVTHGNKTQYERSSG
jgi:hypothetical protein